MTEPASLESPDSCEDRPRQQPGVVRRDCEPHRGKLLVALSRVAFVCGILSVFLIVPGFIGLPLGLAVSRLA